MSNKRSINTTSPEQLLNDNNKKQITKQTMSQQNNADVFSWNIFSSILDEKLKDVAKKEDLVTLKNEIEELKEENKKLRSDINKLATRLEYIDRKTRSANVVVSGLNSTNIIDAKTDFVDLCTNTLKVNINVVTVRSLPSNRTFLFTLETNMQALNVLAAKGNLKGVAIYIQKDYTYDEQHARYNLRKISKNLSALNKNLKVRLGEFCIFVNNKKYTWSTGKVFACSNADADFLRSLLSDANYPLDVVAKDGNVENSNTLNMSHISTQ